MATIQGRGQIQHMELAADADGKVTAVRATLTADMGAYLQLVTPGIPLLGAFLYHGVYDVPAYHFECTGVFTNKSRPPTPTGARAEATYAIERAMDALARQVGVDGAEIRRRNYITPEQFPYESIAGPDLRLGQLRAHAGPGPGAGRLRRHPGRAAAPAGGGETKHLGVGISTYVEMCGLAPSRVLASLNFGAGGWEAATVGCCPPAASRW